MTDQPTSAPGFEAGPRPDGGPAAASVLGSGRTTVAQADGASDAVFEYAAGDDQQPDTGFEPAPDTEPVPDTEPAAGTEPARAPGWQHWEWVEDWRAAGERPAWPQGLAIVAFVVVLVGAFVYDQGVPTASLTVNILINIAGAAVVAPFVRWGLRVPVIRFAAAGVIGGAVLGWLALLLT